MDDIKLFLAHAIALERDAARGYEDLTSAMRTAGNREVAGFFEAMAGFSRKHLKEAMARGGFHDLPALAPEEFQWPEGVSPEQAAWVGVDGLIDVGTALQIALDAERASYRFYSDVRMHTRDHEVKKVAGEFAVEEAEHVAELEKWITRAAA